MAVSKFGDQQVCDFRLYKEFGHENNTDRVKNIDFALDGMYLVSCTESGQIDLYNAARGFQLSTLHGNKYGVDLIRFARSNDNVIHCSTKVNNNVRYLSLVNNKYIYYFPGHAKKVTTLCMSPTEDYFVSGSIDHGLKLWDLRHPKCQGYMHLSGVPTATFDAQGLVLAVGIDSEKLQLFDIRSYEKPFVSVDYPDKGNVNWTDIKYNEDGRLLLISTDGPLIRLANGFNCNPVVEFRDYENDQRLALEATFCASGRYVFSGSTDGHIHVWDTNCGFKLCVLRAQKPRISHCLKFSPKYKLLVSGMANLAIWTDKR